MIIKSTEFVASQKEKLRQELQAINEKLILTIIQVGEDSASTTYVNNKKKVADEVGIVANHVKLPADISQVELIDTIESFQKRSTGIIVQLPLPKHIDEHAVTESIDWRKDVDGFTITNAGKLWNNDKSALLPCTAYGAAEWMEYLLGDLSGLDVVVVNRSGLIGKPISKILMDKNATVTTCHSKTKDLKKKMMLADVVVLGVGTADFIDAETANYINQESLKLIVDVSINFKDGKLCGDFDKSLYQNADNYDYDISSVPGSCGLLTTLYLMKNTLNAYKLQTQTEV